MTTTTRLSLTIAALIAVGSMMTAPAFAYQAQPAAAPAAAPAAQGQETKWQKNHPRRTEVNDRLKNQNKRITNEVKEGEISKSQAQSLRANDKTIRGEERAMASQDNGHITKTDQKALNQQLNQNSQAIGK